MICPRNNQGGVAQSRPWFRMIICPNLSQIYLCSQSSQSLPKLESYKSNIYDPTSVCLLPKCSNSQWERAEQGSSASKCCVLLQHQNKWVKWKIYINCTADISSIFLSRCLFFSVKHTAKQASQLSTLVLCSDESSAKCVWKIMLSKIC